jgi:hypothetical protein
MDDMETVTERPAASKLAVQELLSPAILVESGLIDPSQLAQELKVSKRTLARWHVLRIGPPRTLIGKRVLYKRASVIGWLQTREETGRRPMHYRK